MGYTYSYLIKDEATLIDTGEGSDEARRSFERQLNGAGLGIEDVRGIILTHMHQDHAGLTEYIDKLSDTEILAHERASKLRSPTFDDVKKEMKALGGGEFLSLLNRFEYAFRRRGQYRIDRSLTDNEIVKLNDTELKVIWTPGHAPEHICLFDEERHLLFSGDHLLPSITPNISLHTYEDDDPLGDYIKSLEKIEGLPVNLILPAHEHVFNDIRGRIDELKIHHRARLNEIKEAVRGGEKNVYQIASKISWRSQPWPLMPFWVKRMAAAETLAHLIYLNNKGEIEYEIVNGVRYYRVI